MNPMKKILCAGMRYLIALTKNILIVEKFTMKFKMKFTMRFTKFIWQL